MSESKVGPFHHSGVSAASNRINCCIEAGEVSTPSARFVPRSGTGACADLRSRTRTAGSGGRAGLFSIEPFERYQRSEKALVGTLAEMYVQGVSARKIRAVTEALCGHSFSASSISQINKTLDEGLRAFAERRLTEGFPYTASSTRGTRRCARPASLSARRFWLRWRSTGTVGGRSSVWSTSR
jgi:hypothetical protein